MFISVIMAKGNWKINGNGFGKEKRYYWHIIYENKGNCDKMEVKGHRLHVRRKMNENNGN